MTYWPLKPQLLSPSTPAADDAPQTQFLSAGDAASNYEAAQAAEAAYASAEAAGLDNVPPACVATLAPAGTIASPS
jgi:hypothetical protein